MGETVIAFIIWCVIGLLFIGMGFWANAKMFEVTDVKKYNAAMGKLFCAFGIVFIILGLPLLFGQNSAWIILSAFGVMGEAIVMMGIYTIVIEKKYKKK